ncbi:MAG: hypothetical protein R3D98_00695 [Candidatus Krumholzibacteriia bacterium]
MAVYLPDEKVLCGGSVLEQSLGDLSFADLDRDLETVVTGHGNAVHGEEPVDHDPDWLGAQRPVGSRNRAS